MSHDFSIIASILFIIFQCSAFAIGMMILEDTRYDRRDIVKLVTLFIIPSILLYFVFQLFAVVYFVLFFTLLFRSKSIISTLINILLTVISAVIADHIAASLMVRLAGYHLMQTWLFVIYFIAFIIIMTLLIILLKCLLTILKKNITLYPQYFSIAVVIFLIISAIVFYLLVPADNVTEAHFFWHVRFYTFYFVVSVAGFTLLGRMMRKEAQLKLKEKENEAYYNYTQQLETFNTDVRKFRHDYINILSSMSEYIRQEDIKGLSSYYENHIAPLHTLMADQLSQLKGLQNIRITPVKGLLMSKLILCQEKNIPLEIEVADIITAEDIQMDIILFCRALGIIWDNAIEASNIDHPFIHTGFITTDTSIIFVITNRCDDNIPHVYELYQEGFSTKGPARGLGLATLKDISAVTDNLFLDTQIKDRLFIQKLEVIKNQ